MKEQTRETILEILFALFCAAGVLLPPIYLTQQFVKQGAAARQQQIQQQQLQQQQQATKVGQ